MGGRFLRNVSDLQFELGISLKMSGNIIKNVCNIDMLRGWKERGVSSLSATKAI